MKSEIRKGVGIGDALIGIAVSIGVAGLVTAFVLQIAGDIKTDMTSGSAEYNATGTLITAITKIASKLGIIVTVFMAVLIIGLLVSGFALNKLSA